MRITFLSADGQRQAKPVEIDIFNFCCLPGQLLLLSFKYVAVLIDLYAYILLTERIEGRENEDR